MACDRQAKQKAHGGAWELGRVPPGVVVDITIYVRRRIHAPVIVCAWLQCCRCATLSQTWIALGIAVSGERRKLLAVEIQITVVSTEDVSRIRTRSTPRRRDTDRAGSLDTLRESRTHLQRLR